MLLAIEQTRSSIRCHRRGLLECTLRGLGLNKIGRTAQVPDTPTIRGMITQVRHLVEIIYREIDIRWLAKEVRDKYRDLVVGRIERGQVLWDRFEAAVARCLHDPEGDDRELTECINEIAVAAVLANDRSLDGRRIEYEPSFLPDNRKIDFVVDRGDDNLYIEVKTVRPKTADTDAAWQKFLHLKGTSSENRGLHGYARGDGRCHSRK